MDIVVGSGPTGVACASALLSRGRRVHMVDGGVELESNRASAVAEVQADPARWNNKDVRALLDGSAAANSPDIIKRAFNSDYPFRGAREHLRIEADAAVGLRPSLARGGLSAVWGSVVLPYLDRDTRDWPIRQADLAPHYAAALSITGQAGERDDLADLLPLYAEPEGALRAGAQTRRLRASLERNRDALRKAGIHFGSSRVAITPPKPTGGGCTYCGQCLNGCPWGYIYNSMRTVAELQRHPRFSYQPGIVVEAVREEGARVSVLGQAMIGGSVRLEADRAFLACGVVATTGVILRSLGYFDRTVRIRDSQPYQMPAIMVRGAAGVQSEQLYTASQLFLELDDATVSPYLQHVQVYSYNSIIAHTIRARLGPLRWPLAPFAREADRRFLLFQGCLHSAESGQIAVTLVRRGASDALALDAQPNPVSRKVVRRLMGVLMRHGLKIGAIPVPPLLDMPAIGRGYHAGGSFPMSQSPGALETDVWGRPAGLARVHAVDATVLPSIASTSVTLAAMANAHRIAQRHPET